MGAHLLRPVPPWRESRTWCGLPAAGHAIASPEAFAAFVRSERAKWSKVIRDANIKPE